MKFITTIIQEVDEALKAFLPTERSFHPRLSKAMAYSIFAGGKRLRPILTLLCNQMLNGDKNNAMPAACAIEMIHTYSLIHDDLPAMDNDDLRRGKATNHIAFDEATAILAGDGLLTHAFTTIVEYTPDKIIASKLVSTLSKAAGPRGMVGGQMADMLGNSKNTIKSLEKIHKGKTAAMIAAALKMGAQSAQASHKQANQLYDAGIAMGLAFQITDDLLDIESTSAVLGKSVGKDIAQNKATYPAILGKVKARNLAQKYCQESIDCFNQYGSKADKLIKITQSILDRKK